MAESILGPKHFGIKQTISNKTMEINACHNAIVSTGEWRKPLPQTIPGNVTLSMNS
jgi:hypothetical protein